MTFANKVSSWLNSVTPAGLPGLTIINSAALRKRTGFPDIFEIVPAGGQPLRVEMDEVGAAVSRVVPLLQGKVLRVEGWISSSGDSIRLKKVAAFQYGAV